MSNSNVPKVTPLEGKTTLDDKMAFEPERLSYRCANVLAEKIAGSVKSHVKGNDVVIVGTNFLVDIANLQAVKVMLEQFKQDYEALKQHLIQRKAAPVAPKKVKVVPPEYGLMTEVAVEAAGVAALTTSAAAWGPAVATVLGLVSFFREDVDYRGNQTVVNPLAFELAMAAKVKEIGAKKVLVPDLVVPPTQTGPDSLQARLESVRKAKASVWEAVGPLISELVTLDLELNRAKDDKDQARVDMVSKKIAAMRKDLSPITEQLGQLDKRMADLQTEFNKTYEASGLTMLARWLRAESIQTMAPKYLHAQVVSSGGYSRTSRSLLRMILLGDGLSFMGGATVRWALLDKDEGVLEGGTLSERAWDNSPSLFHPVKK